MIFITATETPRQLYNDNNRSFFLTSFSTTVLRHKKKFFGAGVGGIGFYIETTIEFKCVILAY